MLTDTRYLHERITNVNMIKVVPSNSLPRSRKGGVRYVTGEYFLDLHSLLLLQT